MRHFLDAGGVPRADVLVERLLLLKIERMVVTLSIFQAPMS